MRFRSADGATSAQPVVPSKETEPGRPTVANTVPLSSVLFGVLVLSNVTVNRPAECVPSRLSVVSSCGRRHRVAPASFGWPDDRQSPRHKRHPTAGPKTGSTARKAADLHGAPHARERTGPWLPVSRRETATANGFAQESAHACRRNNVVMFEAGREASGSNDSRGLDRVRSRLPRFGYVSMRNVPALVAVMNVLRSGGSFSRKSTRFQRL